jgi:mannose-6-phosphate isomerase-like protein (cupin superfamily)
VVVNEGEFYIVPRGVEHSPVASQEALVMMFEPTGTAHTGDVEHEQTVKNQEWI